MSVINQMLRDLEDRKQPQEAVEQPVFNVPEPPVWRKPVALVLLLAIIAALVWWFGFASQSTPNQASSGTAQQPALTKESKPSVRPQPSLADPKGPAPSNNEPALAQVAAPAQQTNSTPQTQAQQAVPAATQSQAPAEPQVAQAKAATLTPLSAPPTAPPAAPQQGTDATEQTPVAVAELANGAEMVNEAKERKVEPAKQPQQPVQVSATAGKAKVKLSAMTAEESAQLQLNEARGYAANGRLKDAENAYRTVLTRNPRLTNARLELVGLLSQQRQEAKALQLVNEGLRYQPTNAQLTTVKAQLLLTLGKADDAWGALQQLNESQVSETGFFVIKAGLASQRNDFETAYRNYSRLTIKEPSQGRWWLGKAISAEQVGNNAEAIEGYRRALTSGDISGGSMRYAQHRLDTLGTQPHGEN